MPLIDVREEEFVIRLVGKSSAEIEQEIASACSHTSAPIIFTGGLDDLQKQTLLAHANATLFPIKWREPFGRVMIESMACGTPVIGYKKIGGVSCGAVVEVIEDGVTGSHITAKNDRKPVNASVDALSKIDCIDRRSGANKFKRNWTSVLLAGKLDRVYRRRILDTEKHLEVQSPRLLDVLQKLVRGR